MRWEDGEGGGRSRTYPDEDTLALEVDIGDGELIGERHVVGSCALELCNKQVRNVFKESGVKG